MSERTSAWLRRRLSGRDAEQRPFETIRCRLVVPAMSGVEIGRRVAAGDSGGSELCCWRDAPSARPATTEKTSNFHAISGRRGEANPERRETYELLGGS